MKTHPKKQMTVICEVPVMRRVTRILDQLPVTGYTVFPALSGKGSEGSWDRDNWIGDSGRMVMIVSVMDEDQADEAVNQIYEAIEAQMGIVTVANVQVVRPELF